MIMKTNLTIQYFWRDVHWCVSVVDVDYEDECFLVYAPYGPDAVSFDNCKLICYAST